MWEVHCQDDTHNKVYMWIHNKPYAYEYMQHTKLKHVKQLKCVLRYSWKQTMTLSSSTYSTENPDTIWSHEANECANISLQNLQIFTTTTATTAASTKLQ